MISKIPGCGLKSLISSWLDLCLAPSHPHRRCFGDHSSTVTAPFRPFMMTDVASHLEPGGYLEVQDIDFTPRSVDETLKGTALQHFMLLLVVAARLNERPLNCAKDNEGWMKDVGFENVERRTYRWPQNDWPKMPNKKIGQVAFLILNDWLEGLCMALFRRVYEMPEDWIRQYCNAVRKDLGDPKIHAYFDVLVSQSLRFYWPANLATGSLSTGANQAASQMKSLILPSSAQLRRFWSDASDALAGARNAIEWTINKRSNRDTSPSQHLDNPETPRQPAEK